jgi:hypothetical protein
MIESPGKIRKMGPLKNYTLDQIQHRFAVKSITDYFKMHH